MGIDLGLRDGVSAAEMARELKQYLKNPDKLFRRVRDEHGVLHLSKNAQNYHPGAGVYRSSYKNALRLARTEVNMAYHTADYERWQELDFVVGIEVQLSNNHPVTDICDDLKGKYPKDFKFTGWHPQCRCFAVSILKTVEEMQKETADILEGKEPDNESVNSVGDVPENFKQWAAENRERIAAADKRGALPYFLRDNGGYVSPQKSGELVLGKEFSPEQIANHKDIIKKLVLEQGEPMDFETANALRGNINYSKGGQYQNNCQCCVVANELRRRGFDVTALGNLNKKGAVPYSLSECPAEIWIDPAKNRMPKMDILSSLNGKSLLKDLNDYTQNEGRYHFVYTPKGQQMRHIITVEKLGSNKFIIYDPQNGDNPIFNQLAKNIRFDKNIEIYRVDNLLVNKEMIADVVTNTPKKK